MEVARAESLCRSLIDSHLGSAWSFRWDRAVRRFGLCLWDEKIISLSRLLVEINDEEAVRDTVLHEIAHGLASRRAGHGKQWRQIAEAIGARPSRTIDSESVILPPPALLGRCPSCGRSVRGHRRSKVACRPCCVRFNHGRFSTRFELDWETVGGLGALRR